MNKVPSYAMTAVVAVWAFGLSMALGELYLARAEAQPTVVMTVDGAEYPVCAEEDCSDQPGQVGLWLDEDTGNWWLSKGETSHLVADDAALDID